MFQPVDSRHPSEMAAALWSAVDVAPVWCWEFRLDRGSPAQKKMHIYYSHFTFHDTWASIGLCGLDRENKRNNNKDLILY